jgi:hypothetical protein
MSVVQESDHAGLLEQVQALRARVTQLEQAENERRRADELFHSLLESAPDAMEVTGPDEVSRWDVDLDRAAPVGVATPGQGRSPSPSRAHFLQQSENLCTR